MKKLLLKTALLIIGFANAQTWQNLGTNTVVSTVTGSVSSQLTILSGSNNIPFISATDPANNNLPIVKKLVGNTWTSVGTFIDSNPAIEVALALDNTNTPYVFYQSISDTGTAIINVKKYNGTNWVIIGSLTSIIDNIQNLKIKIDNNNIPYIAYRTYGSTENIKIKRFINNNWVDLDQIFASYITNFDFDLDSNNNVILTYAVYGINFELKALKYTVQNDWEDIGVNALIATNASEPSLVIDSNNNPIVSYFTGVNTDIVVKKFNGTSWIPQGSTVASINLSKQKIAIAPDNTLYISYVNNESNGSFNGSLDIKKLTNTTWNLITSPTSFEQIGADYSFTIGSNNTPIATHETDTAVKAKFYSSGLATNQNEIFTDLKIYPNPVQSFLNIDTKEKITKITIIDLLGKTVLDTNNNFSKIDISNLNTAFYFLKIQTDGFEKAYKISKI